MTDHVVREGEDIYSIAWQHGVSPEALWDRNRELHDARAPHMLEPGDSLTVPDAARPRAPRVSSGSSHRFQGQAPPYNIRLRLRSGGREHPSERYTAQVDGRTHEGTIGAGGVVTIPVRPSTRTVRLTIHEEWDDFTHDHVMDIRVGGLDPATSPTGVQARLSHLGLQPGRVDGDIGPRTRDAIRRFQQQHDLEPHGEIDDATRDRLAQEHGV